MTDKVNTVYNGAIKNPEFLRAIFDSDGDKKPGLFASSLDKAIFATTYYGYLVAKHGNAWKEFV